MQRIGNYQLEQDLGDGYSGTVRLALNTITQTKAALKAPTPDRLAKMPKIAKMMENEWNVGSKLKHQNIIHMIEYKEKAEYEPGEQYRGKYVPILALELCAHGEFCNLICDTGMLPENCARFYFGQLAQALAYLVSLGYAHRDIKPENLLIDANYDLKLIDFAFSCKGTDIVSNIIGTHGYLPPEILAKKGATSFPSDIFAAGVCLFIFVRGIPPFNDGSVTDPHYKMLINKPESFWKYHQIAEPKAPNSPEFKTLIEGMLHPDPEKRFTIHQVLNSDWMKIQTNEEQARSELKARLDKKKKPK